MSFLTEFFSNEVKKTLEDPVERSKTFQGMLEGPLEVQELQRTYAEAPAKPYRYKHLRMNPFYEQRNMMFPHRRFVRREGNE